MLKHNALKIEFDFSKLVLHTIRQMTSKPTKRSATVALDASLQNYNKNQIIRAKAPDRRQVFRHVLGTPFVTDWSYPSDAQQKSILTEFCSCASSVGVHRRKLQQQHKSKAHKLKKNDTSTDIEQKDSLVDISTALAPLEDLVVGINDVTKVLEGMIAHKAHLEASKADKQILNKSKKTAQSMPITDALAVPVTQLGCIFVCRGDMPVAHTYSHLPTMAAICSDRFWICAFSAGAEKTLALALGLKRVSVLGIKADSLRFEMVHKLIQQACNKVHIPWLQNPTKVSYLPTNIRAIKTVGLIKTRNTRVTAKSAMSTPQPTVVDTVNKDKQTISLKRSVDELDKYRSKNMPDLASTVDALAKNTTVADSDTDHKKTKINHQH
ncbi:RNase P and RNase MRP subunit [Batrachochytrium dendrobatidis]